MTETAEPASRPIETELKYRVSDVDAAARYLTAPTVGPFSGNASTRSTQMEDRYVDTADGAFRRAGFAVRLRITGTGTIVSVKSRAKRERRRRRHAARGDRRPRRSRARAVRMAGLRRPLAGARAGR